ncbi:MAG TPA: hypothetical protein VG841_14565 [Caulobacterales bacterium]|nr:hypothetical protein [Caulobacterales bacterium]
MKHIAALVVFLALSACSRAPAPGEALRSACLDDEDAAPQAQIQSCTRYLAETRLSPAERAGALLQRAYLKEQAQQADAALADYNAAVAADPNDANAYIWRRAFYRNRGDYRRALADASMAIRLEPNSANNYSARASIYDEDLHDYQHAIEDLNKAVELSSAGYLFNDRCWVRAKARRALDLALADCERAVAAMPNNANVLDSRALAHFQLGDYQAAFADYDAAVRRQEGNGHSLYGRGVAQLRLGRSAEGQADIAQALKQDEGLAALYASYGVAP